MLNNDMDMTTVTSVEQAAMLAPSSEVRPKRRTFTAAQKLAILREADACPAGTRRAAGRPGGPPGGGGRAPAAACRRHASHIRRYLSGRRPARPTPSAQ